MKQPPRFLKRIVALLLGVAVALGIAECVLRVVPPEMQGFAFEKGRFTTPPEFERDPWRNRLGFHDMEPRPRKKVGRRVLLLGDSYVAALSVPVPRIVGKRIQHHLNRNSRVRYEVVSIGQEDWGPREELAALKRFGPGLAPDLVVELFLPLNDVRNSSPELEEIVARQFWSMDRPRPGWSNLTAENAPGLFIEGSALNRFLSFHLDRLLASKNDREIPLDYEVYAAGYDETWEKAFQSVESLILEMREASRSLGASFCLVSASTPQGVYGAQEGLALLLDAYPAMRNRSWNLDGPNRRLEAFCEKHHIPFLSLEPLFRKEYREHGTRLHWKYDGHWNVAGNDLAGALMAEFIRERFRGEGGKHPAESKKDTGQDGAHAPSTARERRDRRGP